MADRNLTTVQALEVLQKNSDQLFLIVTGLFVFFMQAGFGFREAGSVRSKNTTNILIKTMLNVFISGIAYWGIGYAFAYGTHSNFFLGHSNFFLSLPVVDVTHARWFFQFSLAATCVSIVAGALSERTEFAAYLVYAMLISGFIYPVVSHWAWASTGWLRTGAGNTGLVFPNFAGPLFQDSAGSGVVHMTGGAIALVAAILVGRRIGRFEGRRAVRIPEHNVPLVCLGSFIMFLGLLALNVGAQGTISGPGNGETVAIVTVNTIISASMGGLVAMLLKRVGCLGKPNWTYLSAANGALTGMVSIAAGCNVVYAWGALVIGTIAGLTYCIWSRLLQALRVDDPVDTIAVHLGGGFWGLVAAPILSRTGIIQEVNTMNLKLFGWNLAGAMAILGWGAATALVIFGIMKCFGALRVDGEVEMQGLDIPKHDEPAYPQEGYGNGWRQQSDRKYAGLDNNGYVTTAVPTPTARLALSEKPRVSTYSPVIYDEDAYIREMQMAGRPRDPRDPPVPIPRDLALTRDPRDSASYYVNQPYF